MRYLVQECFEDARVDGCLQGRIPARVLLQSGTNSICISVFFPPEVSRPISHKTPNIVLRSSPSCVQRKLFPPTAAQVPCDNIRGLCWAALKNFNPTLLAKHEERAAHSPATVHCPEAQYAFELHRCLNELLQGTNLQAEFSYASDGRLDLFIPGKRWAIEWLRDGDRTNNHVQLFRPGGIYRGWGIIQDYILLDFCTNRPSNHDYKGKLITLASC